MKKKIIIVSITFVICSALFFYLFGWVPTTYRSLRSNDYILLTDVEWTVSPRTAPAYFGLNTVSKGVAGIKNYLFNNTYPIGVGLVPMNFETIRFKPYVKGVRLILDGRISIKEIREVIPLELALNKKCGYLFYLFEENADQQHQWATETKLRYENTDKDGNSIGSFIAPEIEIPHCAKDIAIEIDIIFRSSNNDCELLKNIKLKYIRSNDIRLEDGWIVQFSAVR